MFLPSDPTIQHAANERTGWTQSSKSKPYQRAVNTDRKTKETAVSRTNTHTPRRLIYRLQPDIKVCGFEATRDAAMCFWLFGGMIDVLKLEQINDQQVINFPKPNVQSVISFDYTPLCHVWAALGFSDLMVPKTDRGLKLFLSQWQNKETQTVFCNMNLKKTNPKLLHDIPCKIHRNIL